MPHRGTLSPALSWQYRWNMGRRGEGGNKARWMGEKNGLFQLWHTPQDRANNSKKQKEREKWERGVGKRTEGHRVLSDGVTVCRCAQSLRKRSVFFSLLTFFISTPEHEVPATFPSSKATQIEPEKSVIMPQAIEYHQHLTIYTWKGSLVVTQTQQLASAFYIKDGVFNYS